MGLKDDKGFSLVELLVTGTIGFLTASGFVVGMSTLHKTNDALFTKTKNENYASQLLEAYRSMTPAQMTTYLSTLREVASGCPLMPGDFNRDGAVDTGDYVKYIRDKLVCGLPTAPGNSPPRNPEIRLPTSARTTSVDRSSCTSDANGDGFVSDLDLEIYRKHFGSPAAPCGAPKCALIPGDFNRDGKVDDVDLAKWTTDSISCSANCADANGDGLVNTADRTVYLENFGKSSPCGIPISTVATLNDPHVYRLCETINPSIAEQLKNTTGRMYYEGIAQLPNSLGIAGAYRSFSVQLVNTDTLEIVPGSCNQAADTVVPGPREIYMLQTEVGATGAPAMKMMMPIPRDLAVARRQAPSADIRANGSNGPIDVASGVEVWITWTSANADSCFVTDTLGSVSATGPSAPPVSVMVYASSTTTFNLVCQTAGFPDATDSVTVNVSAAPIADIKANGSDGPLAIAYNGSVNLSWTSSNATSCSVTAGVTAISSALNNTGLTRSNLTASVTYILTCRKVGFPDVADAVVVDVSPPALPTTRQVEFIFEDRFDRGSSAWDDKDIRVCIEDAGGASAIQYDPATRKMFGTLSNQSIRITYEKQTDSTLNHQVFINIYSTMGAMLSEFGGFTTSTSARNTTVTVQPGQEIRVSWYCTSSSRFCKSPTDTSYRDNNLRLLPLNGDSPEFPPAPRFYTNRCDSGRIN